jgi:magnesium chelatase family protein
MLARRLATVLPSMSFEESIETTKIHSVMGLLERGKAMVGMRPFRSPHHSISDAGLVGGGSIPMPGEVSLAHNGVLFLDELPEFRRHVLEVLRQPVEDGHVTISRATVSLTYPARFMLAAAMNPCPCGFLTDPKRECTCTPLQIRRYRARISGPLLDRVDIHVQVPPLTHDELRATQEGEASSIVRERVEQARQIQVERFSNSPLYCNAHMTSRLLKTHCRLDDASQKLLDTAINQLGLSARANDRILKVSRTVADLAGDDRITATHLSEAIQYRTLDRHMGY